jgi:hypothetical protein
LSLDHQNNALPAAQTTLKRKEFVPKRSLETVLTSLKDRLSDYVDYQSQPMYSMIEEKPKEQRKIIRQLHQACEIDFRNKRVGHILSRMIQNRNRKKDSPIPTITIMDRDSSEDTSQDCEEDSHTQYDFVSNLPPFLQNCEGFSGIQADLKAKLVQERPLETDQQQSIPNLEPECCRDCLAWAQRYYANVSYFQMRLNQVMRQNRELEKDNMKLKIEAQQCISRASKKPKILEILSLKNQQMSILLLDQKCTLLHSRMLNLGNKIFGFISVEFVLFSISCFYCF